MKDGTLRIYEEGKVVHSKPLRAKTEWIQDLKFSPDGNALVVGSHDNFLYYFNVSGGCAALKNPHRFGKSSSFISQFDFSADG